MQHIRQVIKLGITGSVTMATLFLVNILLWTLGLAFGELLHSVISFAIWSTVAAILMKLLGSILNEEHGEGTTSN